MIQGQPDESQPRSIDALKPKMRLQGVVTEIQLYGALVDIGLDRSGMVHISQLSSSRVNRVADVVKPGDKVTVWVSEVDAQRGRVALTMVEPAAVSWSELRPGQVYTGTVVRLEPYGAFLAFGAARPGLLHVREMSSGYIQHPSEILRIGEEIEVQVQEVDRSKRRIDLTMPSPDQAAAEDPEDEPAKTAMEIALERARTERPESKARQDKRESVDLSERASILARTLELHSNS